MYSILNSYLIYNACIKSESGRPFDCNAISDNTKNMLIELCYCRIKMCTDVTHKDFITVHHELAHIQYFLNYRNKPKAFRDGANPGIIL